MSSDNEHKNIFSSSQHLTREELIRYVHHELNANEQHAMEKHLVDCELCSDALTGIGKMENASLLFEITRDLHLRARKRHLLKKKIFSQNELIAIFAVVFLIIFLLLISVFFFVKRDLKRVPGEDHKIENKK